MTELYICYLVVIVPSLIAAIYGVTAILHKHRGLYFTMGVLAVVCILLGQLVFCASSLVGHAEIRSFHIGSLGAMGGNLFFLTANMGPVNSLADDRRPEMRRYRLMALAGPAAAILIYGICVLLMFRANYFVGLGSGLALSVVTVVSLYYSTKLALIPDVEGGFIDCLRPYNAVVTLLGLVNTLERGVRNLWLEDTMLMSVLYISLYAVIGITTLASMIFLKRGAERWENI